MDGLVRHGASTRGGRQPRLRGDLCRGFCKCLLHKLRLPGSNLKGAVDPEGAPRVNPCQPPASARRAVAPPHLRRHDQRVAVPLRRVQRVPQHLAQHDEVKLNGMVLLQPRQRCTG